MYGILTRGSLDAGPVSGHNSVMNLIGLLFQEPLLFVVIVGALLFTLSIHEFAHAYVGYRLGDPTAKNMGRLTVNPLAHIDPFGFLMILIVGFGYARPVPFNPFLLKYPKWGPALVAAAGPASNLVLGIFCSLIYGLLVPQLGVNNLLIVALFFLGQINFALKFFNLIPLPPLDGSKALLAVLSGSKYAQARRLLETQGPTLLIGVILLDIVFNIGVFSWIFGLTSGFFTFFSRLFS